MRDCPSFRLSVVFLNYNRLEETRQTTEQLTAMVCDRPDIEILAVDNHSEDGTAEYLQSQENINTILLPTNDGIAGYNEGFARARGDYILVLDDDSCPDSVETIDRIIQFLDENSSVGILACHIETPQGAPQWKWHLPEPYCSGSSPFFIGCGFAIRRELFCRIGWYPAEFFLYQNEIDVSFKVRNLGYEIYYHAGCKVIHRGVLSSRPGWRCVYYPTRNSIWIIRRYYPQPMATYMIASRIVIGFGRGVCLGEMRAFWRALRDAIAGRIEKTPVSKKIRRVAAPFWRQNSIIHHILRLT